MDPATGAIIAALIAGGTGIASSAMQGGGEFMQSPKLDKRQRQILSQLKNAVQGEGAGGAFGESADYYRSLMKDENPTLSALTAPEMRRFNEQTIPDIAEQFAGMGSGGLSSSGFQNSAVSAGADLSERLGAMRANLRQQGAQGLANLGGLALNDYTNNIYQPPADTGLEDISGALTSASTQMASDYLRNPTIPDNKGAPINTNVQSSKLPEFNYNPRAYNQTAISGKGKTSPYGQAPLSSQIPKPMQMPQFGGGRM